MHNTLTFELGGRVELKDMAEGFQLFNQLVDALSQKGKISWVVDDLHSGSAMATLRGESEDMSLVAQVIDDCNRVGAALEQGEIPSGSQPVKRAARKILNFAVGCDYIRLGTPTADYKISGIVPPAQPQHRVSFGVMAGQVQPLTNRGSLRFVLYDEIHDKAVSCYLEPGQEEKLRQLWGRRAQVSGQISRERDSGRPVSIRRITNIDPIKDVPPGTYRDAKGALPLPIGSPNPEDVIRKMRDA